MSAELTTRLNRILPRIIADDFLHGRGIGNEIAFHIFDYPADQELPVREHIDFLIEQFHRRKPDKELLHVNLFEFLLEYLESRRLLEKSLKFQREKGNKALLKALHGVLHEEKVAKRFAEVVKPTELALVLLSGVGSAFPMLRPHTLLSNLHSVMGQTPLVMFYPGHYDRTQLLLFGKSGLAGNRRSGGKYYRAFRLVD